MTDPTPVILATLTHRSYTPLKPKALARKLKVTDESYPAFRKTLKALIAEGRVEVGRNSTIRAADVAGTVVGTFRRIKSGAGYVRPHPVDGVTGPDVFVREDRSLDASTGDEVVVKLTRKPGRVTEPAGEVVRVQARATRTFVGTYFERDGEAHVRVDGTLFAHSVLVGDPGAKGARQGDKVVVEMVRFPTPDDRGDGVVTEVLGPLSQPGVDTLSIIKAFGLPEAFPKAVLDEARAAADAFREDDLLGRTDFTDQLVITVDPIDARDFDDAVSVEIDPATKHWVLTVHIADVAHFAPLGGPLDAEAKNRATSIYLPQKVIPMFPELISNGLASLQEGKVRYVKTVQIEYTSGLQIADVRFFNGAIRNRKRFTYEEVQEVFDSLASRERKRPEEGPPVAYAPGSPKDIREMLRRMRDLAALLRKKRVKRGMLELAMPETVLEYDADGKMSGAHFAKSDDSHKVIEEFMLAANEAVASHFAKLGVPILRRVHPAPNPEKLGVFGQFAKLLGYPMTNPKDRFELQRVLRETAEKPERAAVHYSLLRSLKQATYSPIPDEHFALASPDYCHFTSPIRRYPDLTVHRLLDRWVRTGKASANKDELAVLGDHCSKRERRAETAERELIKLKILRHLSTRIGDKLDAVITGVADYGFFAQAEQFPAEGLVHISSLTDDYYRFDEDHHALFGGRTKKRFRLGDRVRVEVARVDLQRRMLDLRIVPDQPSAKRGEPFRPDGRRGKVGSTPRGRP